MREVSTWKLSMTFSVQELDGVMQRGGLDPPMDIVYSILESIDMDKSGDIEPCWQALAFRFFSKWQASE